MNQTLNDLFVLLIGIIIALNSISIPVSYQIVSSNLKELLGRDSHLILLEEKSFKRNLYASSGCLLFFILPLYLNIFPEQVVKDKLWNTFQIIYLLFTTLFMIGFFIAFAGFSMRIYEYSSNTEEIIFEKTKNKIDKYLDQEP
jgi:hypothetical protein